MQRLLWIPLSLMAALPAAAQDNSDSMRPDARFGLHFQTTYIYQYSAPFRSPYAGKNSLKAGGETQNSLTATLYAGVRLWKGAEAYLNPELAGGSGLSGALGMGGSSNGETFRVGDPAPTLYLGRLYLQQTFALGASRTARQEDEANAIPLQVPEDFIRLRAGKFSLGDIFDNNEYSNSPRTQFMNWSLMNNGAWDYAANVRGYTYAFAGEVSVKGWSARLAAATLPTMANGPVLETDLGRSISLNFEAARQYRWRGREGNVRLLLYHSSGHFGNYLMASRPADTMDISRTEGAARRSKTGFGLNADQDLGGGLGAFARLGWNDGRNETWCFTEIDQTLALGLVQNGIRWHRPQDELGLAIVVNGLSRPHRDYLADGSYGFILGDGRLRYGLEQIAELYYSWRPLKAGIWFSADYQFCLNPGFNRDRGPANIGSVRVHVEI